MRLIKMLGLAAISAMAATALIGVSSAAASTALCKESANPCPPGQLVTEYHLLAENVTILTSTVNFSCAETLLKGTLLGLGSPQVGHITAFTFTECKTELGTPCSVSAVLLGLMNFSQTGKNKGEVSFEKTSLEYECGSYINCAYGGLPELTILSVLGASLPTHAGLVQANGVKLAEDLNHSHGICPKVAKWDALYEFSEDTYVME